MVLVLLGRSANSRAAGPVPTSIFFEDSKIWEKTLETKAPCALGGFGTFGSLCYEVFSEPGTNRAGFLEKKFVPVVL